MSAQRKAGMTLLEAMIAVGITTAVMALAVSVVGSGVRLARQGEQTVNSNEAARTGMEMLLRDLKVAGVPGGIYVTGAGPPFQVNSIFTAAGASGSDDLWLVVPRPNAMQANCTSPGSGAVITAAGSGALTVNCTATFTTADTLMVNNFKTAALIDGLAFPSTTTITYAQQGVANFSSSPQKGGYLRGDLVFVVDIIRYQVRNNAISGRPELVRQRGSIAVAPTAAAPFDVVVGSPEQRFPDVEDLQVAFGRGVAPALTFTSGHFPAFVPGGGPSAVRVSVVGITPQRIIDDLGQPQPFSPVTVEDHIAPVVIDGYRRSVYRRRVELSNMNPVNL